MATYLTTFSMVSGSTSTFRIPSRTKTVEEFLASFSSDGIMMTPEEFGERSLVNMRDVETISVMKVEE